MLIADYHNHPQAHRTDLPYSPDVLNPWAESAIQHGIHDLALTDHDRYKAGVDFNEINRLQEKYPQIKIRSGIELDNDPETSLDGWRWTEKHWDNLDFVLGSCHFIGDFAFDHPHYISEYSKHNINDLYRAYYLEIQRIAKSGLVDSMAHLDLIKIFKFFPTEDLTSLYEETLDIIAARNLSIEISTAGLRKPVQEIYPSKDIVKMAQARNITFTIAGDAHTAADIAHHYQELQDFLKEMQITSIAIYEKHQKHLVPCS